jgi:Bacterial protein of unknown function (DUF922)
MKKYILVFILLACGEEIFCQDVIINGINKNRLLTWGDFTGKPDINTNHEANTYWSLNFSYQGFLYKGDTVQIKGLSVNLVLDQKRSWVKSGKETVWLLKHEQGHFDIGLICQKEIIDQLNSTVFHKSELPEKLHAVFNSILNNYRSLSLKYDEETNHSQNHAKQSTWNDFFVGELIR